MVCDIFINMYISVFIIDYLLFISSKQSRAALDWDSAGGGGGGGDTQIHHPGGNNNKGQLQIVYVSQQQLKDFNLPYQLGYSNLPHHINNSKNSEMTASFETPKDADTGMRLSLLYK